MCIPQKGVRATRRKAVEQNNDNNSNHRVDFSRRSRTQPDETDKRKLSRTTRANHRENRRHTHTHTKAKGNSSPRRNGHGASWTISGLFFNRGQFNGPRAARRGNVNDHRNPDHGHRRRRHHHHHSQFRWVSRRFDDSTWSWGNVNLPNFFLSKSFMVLLASTEAAKLDTPQFSSNLCSLFCGFWTFGQPGYNEMKRFWQHCIGGKEFWRTWDIQCTILYVHCNKFKITDIYRIKLFDQIMLFVLSKINFKIVTAKYPFILRLNLFVITVSLEKTSATSKTLNLSSILPSWLPDPVHHNKIGYYGIKHQIVINVYDRRSVQLEDLRRLRCRGNSLPLPSGNPRAGPNTFDNTFLRIPPLWCVFLWQVLWIRAIKLLATTAAYDHTSSANTFWRNSWVGSITKFIVYFLILFWYFSSSWGGYQLPNSPKIDESSQRKKVLLETAAAAEWC